jgi:hypothetical protein
VFSGEVGDEFFVGVRGFAAQLVIEVDYGGNEANLFAEFEEQEKQRDGIRAAGNCYAEAQAGA